MRQYLLPMMLALILLLASTNSIRAQGDNNNDNGDNNNNNNTDNNNNNNNTSNITSDARCNDLGFSCDDLKRELITAYKQDNGGIGFNVWAAAVDRSGYTCCVVYSGNNTDSQWGASRILSVAKAYTANGFSLPELALSSGNLYSLVQPGNLLYGMDHNLPVDNDIAYDGNNDDFGQGTKDPLYGKRLGGLVVYGGGLALYKCESGTTKVVGAIAVDGDTSCADHAIAWKVRHALNGDFVPAGVHSSSSGNVTDDNLIFLSEEPSSGFAHPRCTSSGTETTIRDQLPTVQQCR